MICPKCNQEIADGLDVCPICGEVLTAPAAEAAPEEVVVEAAVVTDAPAGKKKFNVIALIGMILGILNLGIFTGWLYTIPALVLSIIGKKKAKVTGSGKTFATVGMILSIVKLALIALSVVAAVLYYVIVVVILGGAAVYGATMY